MNVQIIFVYCLFVIVSCADEETLKTYMEYMRYTVCDKEKHDKGMECLKLIPGKVRKSALTITGEDNSEAASVKLCNNPDLVEKVKELLYESSEENQMGEEFWKEMFECLENAKSG